MDEDDHRGHDVPPLFLGVLGILAAAIIVVTLHCITSIWCKYRRVASPPPNQPQISRFGLRRQMPGNTDTNTDTNTNTNTAHLVKVSEHCCEESCCAVCLCEFKEGEEVRVLPECEHSFHAPCVDMWLFSHPNCPLCRAKAATPPPHMAVSLPDAGGTLQPELSRVPDFGG